MQGQYEAKPHPYCRLGCSSEAAGRIEQLSKRKGAVVQRRISYPLTHEWRPGQFFEVEVK